MVGGFVNQLIKKFWHKNSLCSWLAYIANNIDPDQTVSWSSLIASWSSLTRVYRVHFNN